VSLVCDQFGVQGRDVLQQRHMIHALIKFLCRSSGEYVALEAVETAIVGGASQFIDNGCCWVYGDSTQRRVVAVVVPCGNTWVSFPFRYLLWLFVHTFQEFKHLG